MPGTERRTVVPPIGLILASAFSAIVGSINNLGPGLGEVGPAVNSPSNDGPECLEAA